MTDPVNIDYIAHLSRISLSEDEKLEFAPQIEKIIHFVEQLSELDVEGIEPTAHAIPLHNVFREDSIRPSLQKELVLRNAPALVQDLIKMPKIVE